MVSGTLILGGFGAVVVLIGAAIVRQGYLERRTASAVADHDPRPIESLTPGDGAVAVDGTARPAGEGTVDAPIAGTEGVVVDTEVAKFIPGSPGNAAERTGGGSDPRRRDKWRYRQEVVERVPFVVEGEDAEVRVEVPTEANVDVARTSKRDVRDVDDPPPAVQEFLADGGEDVILTDSTKYRFRQGAVEPRQPVYVLAQGVEETTGWDGPDVTLTGDGAPSDVVVTTREQDRMAEEATSGTLAKYVVGAVVFLVGTGLLAAGLAL